MQETEKNRVNVEINGKEYTVAAEETTDYIEKIAKEVDGRIRKLSENSGIINASVKFILVSLDLADELEKCKESSMRFQAELEQEQERNQALQKTIQNLRKELESYGQESRKKNSDNERQQAGDKKES